MYELLLQPGGTSGTDFYSHQGEKAGVVVAGTLQLWLDEQAHLLSEGDSSSFRACCRTGSTIRAASRAA